jgi:uncharacterized protein (TIGR00369 family)
MNAGDLPPKDASASEPTPEILRQLADRMAGGTPQSQALGLEFVSVSPGHGSMSVAWREDLVGDPDTQVIAGGVVTSLLDHTCGLAISSAAASASGMFGTATLDLRIDYMRPARPRAGVTAAAHCYKLTHTIGFVRAEAWDEDRSDPIATAQAAFALTGPRPA